MIDNGNAFDWNKSSADYAKYRDIYPQKMYETLFALDVGVSGQKVLDIGTGTGVLPRNMYPYGASFTGIDVAENQIAFARTLSEQAGMAIDYAVSGAESLPFSDNSFDCITAFQCWMYVDTARAIPEILRVLKPDGELLIGYMAWLPDENSIVQNSFDVVNQFNPNWNGWDNRKEIDVPHWVADNFRMRTFHAFDVDLPFTYDTWNGRMKASRGIGASLSSKEVEAFSKTHLTMLKATVQEPFTISHEIVLQKFKSLKKY